MKRAKHTKGPWTLAELSKGETPNIEVYEGQTSYRLAVVSAEGSGDLEANARLIAAAPEMLEALEYLLRAVAQVPDDMWHRLVKYDGEYAEISPVDMARDAIAKAKGEL